MSLVYPLLLLPLSVEQPSSKVQLHYPLKLWAGAECGFHASSTSSSKQWQEPPSLRIHP